MQRNPNIVTECDAEDASDMEALRAGEDLALNRIMGRHRDKIFHYLIRLLQDEEEALDLAQETFVRVHLSREKFNSNNRFSSWLYAIATNLARDRMRWLARHRNISLEMTVDNGETKLGDLLRESHLAPNESLERDEQINQVKEALADIPEELRTPLVLVEYEDMSQAEVAAVLNCTPKSVENRLYRARKLLREKLSRLLSEEKGVGH
jgi:RNA polymerase sigma-70 factor (ECF subfamily)